MLELTQKLIVTLTVTLTVTIVTIDRHLDRQSKQRVTIKSQE
ncbi:MAG: hypothetical protein ACREBD_21940 [Blastocatellia bacterium]